MTTAAEEETVFVPLTPEDRARRRMLVAVCFVLFATMLDTTIVSVALGDLEKTTTLSLGDLQWVLNGYLVMFTAFMLAGGTLADAFGRRTFLMIGLAVFAFGSLLCVAGGAHYLVVGRLVQGVGAAMSEPATLAVIRHEYEDPAERTRALGVWAATGGIALAVGPVLGGILVAAGGWKAVFVFNIPLALVCIVVGYFLVPNSSDPDPEALDLLGLGLAAVAIIGVSYLFIHSQSSGFASAGSVVSLLLTVAAAGGFLFWQRRSPAPLLPRGLFASGFVRGGAIGTLVSGFALYAVFFFGTLDLSVVGGRSAAVTAAAFVPMMIAMISCAIFGGNWAAARGPAEPLAAGLFIAAIATGLAIPTLGVDPQAPVVAVVFMVAGIGLGLSLAPGASAIMSGVSADRSGLAAAVVNEARMLGGLLAVAILGNITVGRLQSGIVSRVCSPGNFLCSFKGQILHAVTHGQNDPATKQVSALKAIPSVSKYIDQALSAAYSAFASGMRFALAVTVVLLVLATIYVVVFRRSTAPVLAPAVAGVPIEAAPAAPAEAVEVTEPAPAPVAPPAWTPPPAQAPPPVQPPPAAAPPPPPVAPPPVQPPPPPAAPPAAAPPAAEPVPVASPPADPGWAPPIEPSSPEPAKNDESWSEAERWWQEGQGG